MKRIRTIFLAALAVAVLWPVFADAASLVPGALYRAYEDDGTPCVGCKLYTYESGTTTAKDTYSDAAGTVVNTNPIIFDARGEASVYWDGLYSVKLTDPSDVTLWGTIDDYGAASLDPSADAGNLVSNGSFETDTDGDGTPDNWTFATLAGGSVTIVSSSSSHAAKSAYFVSTGTGGGTATTDFIEVNADDLIAFFVSIKTGATVNAANMAQIAWYDASQTVISTSTYLNDTTVRASWTRLRYTATPPALSRYAKVILSGVVASGASGAETTWFDNARLTTVTAPMGAGAFDATANTATRTYTLPDESATLATTSQAYRRRINANGDGVIRQASAYDLSAVGALVYGYGPDWWEGSWNGTTCTAGSFTNTTAAPNGRTGNGIHLSGVTLTGTGILYARTKIESKEAKRLKNQAAIFNVNVQHDVGSDVDFTVDIYKADVADDFSASTLIVGGSAVSVASGTATDVSVSTSDMGDCSNGVLIVVKAETGAITTKNIYLTEAQIEVGTVASQYEWRDYSAEWDSARRRYRTYGGNSTSEMISTGFNDSTTRHNGRIALDPPMASAPTVTISNATHFGVRHKGPTATACTAFSYTSTAASVNVLFDVAAGLTAGEGSHTYTSSTSGRLILDSRL